MFGYRDEGLWGEGYDDIREVAYHEGWVLGNGDVWEGLLRLGAGVLGDEERVYIASLAKSEVDEADKAYVSDIVEKAVAGRLFCKWLCARPRDVYESYVEQFSGYDGIDYEEWLDGVDAYEIPRDAVALVDLGPEGTLWCWDAAKHPPRTVSAREACSESKAEATHARR